jgi:hypothetical protein
MKLGTLFEKKRQAAEKATLELEKKGLMHVTQRVYLSHAGP